jgi:Uma2 family endonuclease
MGHAAAVHRMTASDFIAWDATQTVRHEFVGGEVFAMAGAGEAHVTVAGNLYVHLRQHLAGSPCRTFITDMKLHVEAADAFFYPDVMVTCSAVDAGDPLVKRAPVLLAEVLSPSTEAYDRGAKFAAYRLLPSLREVLLVDTDGRRCDLFRKGDDGLWVLHPAERGQDVHLASLDLRVPAAALWAEVPEPASPPAPATGQG